MGPEQVDNLGLRYINGFREIDLAFEEKRKSKENMGNLINARTNY